MHRWYGLGVSVLLSIVGAGAAGAQTWEGKSELKPNSKSTCPRASVIFDFAISGAELSAKGKGGGVSMNGPIAADGRVTLYGRSQAFGQIEMSGNTRTKDLQVTSSTYPGCVYAVVSAGDLNAGLVSAYQGNVGDWALGRWNGRIVGNFAGVGLTEYPRALIVEKLPDGRAGCRYGEASAVGGLAWTPKCTITANGISLATEANTTVELARADARRIEGRVREAATAQAYTIFLERAP